MKTRPQGKKRGMMRGWAVRIDPWIKGASEQVAQPIVVKGGQRILRGSAVR